MVGVVGGLRPSWRAGFAGLPLARRIHDYSFKYGDLLDQRCITLYNWYIFYKTALMYDWS
jgi:hypothetical protein